MFSKANRRLLLILIFIVTVFSVTIAALLTYLYIDSHPKLDVQGKSVAPLRDVRVVAGIFTLLAGSIINHAFGALRSEQASQTREEKVEKLALTTEKIALRVVPDAEGNAVNGLPCNTQLDAIAAQLDRIEQSIAKLLPLEE